MKEFRLYAGMTEDNMTEVLHTGLKNDSVPEHFQVKNTNSADVVFPTRYVKIVPLSYVGRSADLFQSSSSPRAHGQSFHISIWYVALSGITDATYLERIQALHDEVRPHLLL